MAAKKRKEIAQEVKELGTEGQDVVQQVTNLEKLVESSISTFEDQSEGVTAEAIRSTSKANIRFQNTVEKKVDQKIQEGEEIYYELSVKQENFELAIVADKTDISNLNILKEQANSEQINSSEIDKAGESKQEEIEFLQGQSQIVQENQKELKSKILNSKRRRQAAQSNYHTKSSLPSSEQDINKAIEHLFEASENTEQSGSGNENSDSGNSGSGNIFTSATGEHSATPITPMNVRHVFHGEINKRGKAIGFHHRGSIGHHGIAEIIPGTESKLDSHGVYTAQVQVCGVRKTARSSFFPDSWSRQQVWDEIMGAYNSDTVVIRRGGWRGTSPSGVEIHGYIVDGKIHTAFPIHLGEDDAV